jgi:DNA end-binding protein Ku
MAERPIWRGHLRLALVSCPVALYSARHDSGSLHFHFINPATGNRVRTVTLDAETGEEMSRRDLARGYEYDKDHYVLLDDGDFEQARIESSTTLTVDKFVPADAIDPVYFDSSYYMAPDGDAGQDVYVVLRDAIAKTGRVALSRVVIARRERAVALMPMGNGLVLHTLHEPATINDPKSVFDGVPALKPEPDMVALATQLIDRQTGKFDLSDMTDRYEARLREVIAAKLKGQGVKPLAAPKEASNVVDLMAALKRSLGQTVDKPASKPAKAKAPAKAPAKKPTRKRA